MATQIIYQTDPFSRLNQPENSLKGQQGAKICLIVLLVILYDSNELPVKFWIHIYSYIMNYKLTLKS